MNKVTVRDGEKKGCISPGDLWEYAGELYLLVVVEYRKVALINLKNGYRYRVENHNVCSLMDITGQEWEKITDGNLFTRIYHVEIEAEGGQ